MPISKVILWKISKKRFGKSLFYFSISSATTYLNVNIGGFCSTLKTSFKYSSLLNEIIAVATAAIVKHDKNAQKTPTTSLQ
jgi:hypothetical protein